jgi:GT2 family glycosyltransferase
MKEGHLWLVIPTSNRFDYLNKIIRNSLIPEENIVLVRTENGPVFGNVKNIFVKTGKVNIQKWWNVGINYAEKHGARLVAVLNDDVYISPGSLQAIALEVLEQNAALGFPYPHSGCLAGYCWILNLNSAVRPDERFKWHFGDNDLQMQAQFSSKYIYVSADVQHLEGGKLTEENQSLKLLAERDHVAFIQKWGDRPTLFQVSKTFLYRILGIVKSILKKSKFLMSIKKSRNRNL